MRIIIVFLLRNTTLKNIKVHLLRHLVKHIKNRTIITFSEVKRYMNNLPPARQLFIMNYKKNAEKRQNVVNKSQDPEKDEETN